MFNAQTMNSCGYKISQHLNKYWIILSFHYIMFSTGTFLVPESCFTLFVISVLLVTVLRDQRRSLTCISRIF